MHFHHGAKARIAVKLRRLRGAQVCALAARTGNAICFSSDRNSSGVLSTPLGWRLHAQDVRQLRLAGAICHAPGAATF